MSPNRHRLSRVSRVVAALAISVFATALILSSSPAGAATAPNLGTAGSFAVLAGEGVTNTGPTLITGDLGTSPNPAITGSPVVIGAIHAADAVALQAKSDLVIAYDAAADASPSVTFAGPTDLVGMTLVAGVYRSPSSLALAGTVTLDAQNDPDAVFIFQAGSTLITAVNSTVSLINGAQACNVFWQVASSATLGVDSEFVGTVMALSSIEAQTNATVNGRLLARNASTTLDSNVITRSVCATPTTTTTAAGPTTTGAPAATTTTAAPGATTTTAAAPGATTTTAAAPGATTTTAAAPAATTTTTAAVFVPSALGTGPVAPAAPAAPGALTAPAAPAAPATPAAPGTPVAPGSPSTPGAPAIPGLPSTGVNVFTLVILGVGLLVLGICTVAIGPRLRKPRLR